MRDNRLDPVFNDLIERREEGSAAAKVIMNNLYGQIT